MLADTGGTGVGLIGQQGRAEQGLEMHWTEVTLAVTNRCSSLLSVSRRACHAVFARLPCTQCIQRTAVGCPALQRTAYASKWERSIAAGEWMDGPASAWELHRSRLCCIQNLLGCIQPGCLSGSSWVRSLVRGTPRKGLD